MRELYLKRVFYACLIVVIFASLALAAEGGALAQTAAKREAANQSAASLGAGNTSSGPGVDLKAIASPKKAPTTFTGFPAGTLPGGGSGGTSSPAATPPAPEGSVVLIGSGAPLTPVVGSGLIGTKLDRVCAIADHAGYSLVRQRYVSNTLDSAYTYNLMSGRRKLSTLYFDRSMKLLFVQ